MRYIITLLLLLFSVSSYAQYDFGDQNLVRLKDIGQVLESRDNQLIGYGLVVGLRNTGDTRMSEFTSKALTNLLKKMGVAPDKNNYKSRNVASVMVTASLPPYIKPGQKISVTVSSMGDASSLEGGTLLMTPLMGSDFEVYGVAQGSVVIGGISSASTRMSFKKNQSTVGRVPLGAIVEKEVPVTLSDYENITIVLEEPNFSTASRVSLALNSAGFKGSQAIDPSTIKVPVDNLKTMTYVEAIAAIETIEVVPDSSSKVVINARTGTVIIGEKVRLYPVAITHGNISIKIKGLAQDAQVKYFAVADDETEDIEVYEEPSRVVYLEPEANLSSLVDSLNQLGVTAKDMISILQALKEAGSLIGTIEVL